MCPRRLTSFPWGPRQLDPTPSGAALVPVASRRRERPGRRGAGRLPTGTEAHHAHSHFIVLCESCGVPTPWGPCVPSYHRPGWECMENSAKTLLGGICILTEANPLNQINPSLQGRFQAAVHSWVRGAILRRWVDLRACLTAPSAGPTKNHSSKAMRPHPWGGLVRGGVRCSLSTPRQGVGTQRGRLCRSSVSFEANPEIAQSSSALAEAKGGSPVLSADRRPV